MQLPPKEFIYKDKQDIDEYIENNELNSDIYEVFLKVREHDSSIDRYQLKRSAVEIFNEAYYQATKAFLDKHPEDNFEQYYIYDTRCHLGLAYETTLVLSIVYVILASQAELTVPLKRFISSIEAKYKEDKWYFPFFKEIVDRYKEEGKTFKSDFSRPEIDLSNLQNKDWMELTGKYDRNSIEAYVRLGKDNAQKLEIIDAIQARYKIDMEMDELEFLFVPDLTQFFSGLKKLINLQTDESSTKSSEIQKTLDNPLVVKVKSLEEQIQSLNKRICELVQENEKLKKIQSEEKSLKIRDIVREMRTFPIQTQISMLTLLRSLIADQDQNWIEKFKAEEDRLAASENSNNATASTKKNLCLNVATDLMVILLKKARISAYADNTTTANLIALITDYSPNKIRQRLSSQSPIAYMHAPEVEAVNKVLEDLRIDDYLTVASR